MERRRVKLFSENLFLENKVLAQKLHVAMQTTRGIWLELLKHLSYSQHLAPSDYYGFPQLKKKKLSILNFLEQRGTRCCGELTCRAR